VEVSCGVGECRVRLPGDEVRVDLERASLTLGEQNIQGLDRRASPPAGAPVLTLSVSGTLGEMTIGE
jgi:hypothetical protein